ncbi:MAG: histidine kinase dimerization/phospho-acceptor domain-containing protein, partial [Bacteroidota bacterium]|nr:histidine kinase dimerization/phospho-acceptor domain-containing protein [Bacteroidota bacterium]
MKQNYINIIPVLIFSIIFFSCNNERDSTASVQKGVIDISKHDFEKDGILNLKGEWEFYYNKLAEPKDFADSSFNIKPSYITVPKPWSKQKNNKSYKDKGYATYRLVFYGSENTIPLALEIRRIFTASKIWLNGELIKEYGKISANEKGYEPWVVMTFFGPFELNRENELVIQVENYKDPKSGIISPVRIGEYTKFYNQKIIDLVFFISALAAMLIIGIYHIMIYFYLQKDFSTLVFSSLAFLFVIYGLATYDSLLKNIIYIGFETFSRAGYFVVTVYPALMAVFFYLLFKKEVSKKIIYIILILSGLLFLFDMFGDSYTVRSFLFLNAILFSSIAVYLLFYVLPKAVINKRQGASWALAGMFFLVVINIQDLLFGLGIINTMYLSHYGFTLYVIFQSVNIAERYSFAFKRNIRLRKDIKLSNELLLEAKNKAERSEQLKSAFLANMSHEIRTPMNAIIGFSQLLSNSDEDAYQQEEYIEIINSNGQSLLRLIDDIIDFSKIEANQMTINKTDFMINPVLKEVYTVFNKSKIRSSKPDIKFIINLQEQD